MSGIDTFAVWSNPFDNTDILITTLLFSKLDWMSQCELQTKERERGRKKSILIKYNSFGRISLSPVENITNISTDKILGNKSAETERERFLWSSFGRSKFQ